MNIHIVTGDRRDKASPCPLCRAGTRHPLCDLYSHYEAMARDEQEGIFRRRRALMAAFWAGEIK